MGQARVRSYVNLPEIARGQIGTLPDDARLRGLLAAGLVELVGRREPTPVPTPVRPPQMPQESAEIARVDVDQGDPSVPQGTVRELLDWVGDDVDRASAALDAELAATVARSTLVARLLALTDPTAE
jgi:hypothetical protein